MASTSAQLEISASQLTNVDPTTTETPLPKPVRVVQLDVYLVMAHYLLNVLPVTKDSTTLQLPVPVLPLDNVLKTTSPIPT